MLGRGFCDAVEVGFERSPFEGAASYHFFLCFGRSAFFTNEVSKEYRDRTSHELELVIVLGTFMRLFHTLIRLLLWSADSCLERTQNRYWALMSLACMDSSPEGQRDRPRNNILY
jgi:hypothetical protein